MNFNLLATIELSTNSNDNNTINNNNNIDNELNQNITIQTNEMAEQLVNYASNLASIAVENFNSNAIPRYGSVGKFMSKYAYCM